MPAPITLSTTFSLDDIGRYVCNTLAEATASQDPTVHADARPFDFIVIGGGSFGAVAATHLFDIDTAHRYRVLVLEAGPLALPEHVQNLPSDLNPPGKGSPGTIWGQPWNSDSPMVWNQNFPGLAYCLGGRSVFWGGWSPYLIDSELADPSWPASIKKDLTQKVLPPQNPVESYLDAAARQIGTDTTNDFVFGPLHEALRQRLFEGLQGRAVADPVLTGNRGALATIQDLEAPLAVQSAPSRPGSFPLNKFNGVQLLIRASRVAESEAQQAAPFDLGAADAKKRLMIVDNVYVTRLVRRGGRITRVETNQGGIDVPRGGAVLLAMGTIENTRMALNTVPEKNLIGRNLMAHLRSNLTIRAPHSSFQSLNLTKELAVSALFVKGIRTRANGSKGHFHIQITASGVGELGMNSEAELFKKIPNIDELDAFQDLNDKWVVITLRGIGEMIGDKVSADPQNRVALGLPDGNGVPRALVRLETNPKDASDPRGDEDNKLWDVMDAACDEVARMFAGNGPIQYLSLPNDPGNSVWQPNPPARDSRRDALSSTHHESGTLWMGSNATSSVTDESGRIWELDNLYVVGPAVLPTMGSPNPMLTGVALSRRTAERLVAPPSIPKVDAGFEYLFDGTEKTFQRWRSAGPGSFALVDGMLVAQPGLPFTVDGVSVPVGAHSVFFYAAEAFNDLTLRLQFRLAGPIGGSGRPVDNSGIFLRFHAPHGKGPDLPTNGDPALAQNVAADAAWVAAYTGFEIQIDENAAPDGADKHRTGAVYNVPTGSGGLQSFTAAPALTPGGWNDMEITVRNHRYTVSINGQQTTDFTNPRSDLVTDPPGLPLKLRGLPASENPLSGYIGVQAHTANVAFRNIRIKRL
jgi:choline dehydrogenase-like flavoprotein